MLTGYALGAQHRRFAFWKDSGEIPALSSLPEQNQSHPASSPDRETASDGYKRRFASETGRWFLDEQASGLLSMLDRWQRASILDVGGGHGQYTEKLIQAGYSVTILGGSLEANKQVLGLLAEERCRYVVGDFCRFPFPDRSFDIVVSFRLMAHLPHWENFIAESARVSRCAVVIDFPVTHSFNMTYPFFFRLKRKLEHSTTRTFTVFDEKQVAEAYLRNGFRPTGRHAQYFFPMVLHRVLHQAAISRKIEKFCRSCSLTDHFGSPVILRLEPRKAM